MIQPVFGLEVHVPDWAKEAVWYQVFPERFRNGDSTNDPTRASLEWPVRPSEKWRITTWTADWYARDEWETEQDKKQSPDASPAFYRNGVFDRRYGGDLQGVIDKLDYIKSLGVNAIYFNPVFYARSLHKYDGNSFHHVDPYLGPDPKGDFEIMDRETADPSTWQWTAADKLFLELIKQAHARGIRVVIDGVFNHTGRDFFAFADVRKNGNNSPYSGWYQVDSFDDPATTRSEFSYRGWWGHKTLPIFAATPDGKDMAQGPKDYVFNITRRWMDPNGDGDPSDGVDGWRLDVADERPAKFWADWNALVRKINPNAYTTAEVWSNPLELIEHGSFSASMNYYGFALPVTGFFIDENLPASRFSAMLDERRNALPKPIAYAMQNMVDSHDTDRMASMIVNGHNHGNPDHIDYNNQNNARLSTTYQLREPNDRERAIQRLIGLFQMTYVGAPMIFYGTEAGMWGGHDPDCRMPMVWEDLKYDPQAIDPRGGDRKPDAIRFNPDLFAFYRAAIELRRNNPALSIGEYQALGAFDQQKTLVYLRKLGDRAFVVALNRSESPQTVTVDLPTADAALLEGAAPVFVTSKGAPAGISVNGGRAVITLGPLTGAVYAK
ncbi:MAG: glycoside hydrolase family 13 protein [Terrimicrobiaceae bacterium]|nr:glycoside hydrolase family 13 protein [Terrimicrobiaceae bacterium]